MNDEYLWQKTGTDPEIEKLENVLSVFRYREDPAPETIPVKAIAPVQPRRRWRLSLAFAFASCVAVVIAAAWFLVLRDGNGSTRDADDLVFVQETPPATTPVQVSEPEPQPVQQPRNPEPPQSGRPRKISPTSAALHPRSTPKDGAPKDSIAALTKEERHAYRQLMLALSISGSKLKIVQNTIDGTEETEGSYNKNKR